MVRIGHNLVTNTKMVKKAFTMIELIYAIVVIGVTVLTVPMMIQVNNKALEGSITQEAVFLVSSVLSITTTLVWDNRSIPATTGTENYVLSKMLDVDGVGSKYGRVDVNSTQRVGGSNEDLHRQFFTYDTSNPSKYKPAQNSVITLNASIDNSDSGLLQYKNTYTVTATRGYVPDDVNTLKMTADGTPTNLKMTEVTLKNDVGEIVTVLRAYTANIGEVDFARRRF